YGTRDRGWDRARHGDLPEDPVVLHPLRALAQWADVEAICARCRRRAHRELEPGDLVRPHISGRLHRDSVVARPARVRRARAITAEDARLVLTRARVPRAEVGDLARHAAHPSSRSGVVHGDGSGRGIARTERHVSALSVPGGVEARGPRGNARGWRNAGTDARS